MMSLSKKVTILSFLSLSFIGCSTVNTTPLSNKEKDVIIVGSNNSPQTDQAKTIKEKGWQIPSPKKMRKTGTGLKNFPSELGTSVEVSFISYFTEEKFIYTEEPSEGNLTMVVGELELGNFTEIKARNKTFAYVIFARKPSVKTSSNSHNHTFFYRIMDNNGDGKFETLVSDDSDLIVPGWVTQ